MKVGFVDRVAFWAINHLLSRPRNQRFDRDEFEQFHARWQGKTIHGFYQMEEFSGEAAALEKIASLKSPCCQQMELATPVPSAFERNNHIWVEFHLGKPIDAAPFFFIQHGWRSVSVRGYHAMCRHLNGMGVNAGILHLPYHYSRRPSGSFNGEMAICGDVARSAHALRQAVSEVRWLKGLLKKLGTPHVGLWGTSYGAWISGMALALDDGFDGALLLEPPVDIEELFWETPLFSGLQQELNRLGIPRERLKELFRLVTPALHPLRIPGDRVIILGAERDPIAHPDSLKRLHAAWPGSHLEIFPYGHISYRLHTSAMKCFLERLAPRLLD